MSYVTSMDPAEIFGGGLQGSLISKYWCICLQAAIHMISFRVCTPVDPCVACDYPCTNYRNRPRYLPLSDVFSCDSLNQPIIPTSVTEWNIHVVPPRHQHYSLFTLHHPMITPLFTMTPHHPNVLPLNSTTHCYYHWPTNSHYSKQSVPTCLITLHHLFLRIYINVRKTSTLNNIQSE